MLRALARSMTLSNATVPQFTVERAVDWTSVYRLRAETTGTVQVPSINDFILQAIAAALLAFPALNATFSGDVSSTDARIEPTSDTQNNQEETKKKKKHEPKKQDKEQFGLAELTRRRRDLVERALT